MKRIVIAALLTLCSCSSVLSMWAMLSLDELMGDTDLIVVGTLKSAIENEEGIGEGEIVIHQVISRGSLTFAGRELEVGDRLRITWADDWACAAGMHKARENQRGIWLLKGASDGSVKAGYPGRFRKMEDLWDIEKIMRREETRRITKPIVHVAVADTRDRRIGSLRDTVDLAFTQFVPNALFRALWAALVSLGLYAFLYRRQFKIR